MFGKPKCRKCSQKVSKKYFYCPYCAYSLKEEDKDKFFEPIFKLGFPFNHLFKEIEKQFHEIDTKLGEEGTSNEDLLKSTGLSINIDSSNGQPTIRIRTNNNKKKMAEAPAPQGNIQNKNIFRNFVP